jgi:hypothetical protein
LRTDLDSQQEANARLVGENEELKAKSLQMQTTIATLTSNKDSLARQYLDLKNAKDKLDDFSETLGALRTRITEEKTEGSTYNGKAQLYLKDVLLGSLIWSIPIYLNHDESKNGDVTFVAESIDYVRLTPVERRLLRTLGERLKIRLDLNSESPAMEVASEKGSGTRELKERDRSTWQWTIRNLGAEDVRLTLTARLINRNSDEITFFKDQYAVISSTAIRQIRNYLKPIPISVGIVLGFLLFGVVGIFRRSKHHTSRQKDSSIDTSPPPAYTGKKQL